jgi:tetratricopeptide (TPR) repeat protein
LGAALINLGRIDEGEALVERALETFRSDENRRLIALARRTLAGAATLHGQIERAGELYREALSLASALADERGMKIINANLAEIEFATGNTESALQHAYEALEIARQHRDVFVCGSLLNISAYLIALKRYEEARSAAREAIAVAREIENDLYLAIAIQHLGAVGAACGDPVRAARLLAFSDVVYAAASSQREPTEAKEYEESLAAIRKLMDSDDVARSFREGGKLTSDLAIAEAMLV